jgi:hypothetical protein
MNFLSHVAVETVAEFYSIGRRIALQLAIEDSNIFPNAFHVINVSKFIFNANISEIGNLLEIFNMW